MDSLPPTPKPRTRFNCVKPDDQRNNNNGDADRQITTNGAGDVETSMSSNGVYPSLGFAAPPKPPREAPPRPPPPGWNVQAQRVAPSPPTAHISSGVSPPQRKAPVPPEKPLPAVPARPLHLSQVVPLDAPGDRSSSLNKSVITEEFSPTLIENTVYLTLEKFREISASTSSESGFVSPDARINGYTGVSSDTDESSSVDDFIVPSSSVTESPPGSLLDQKPLPPIPQSSRKSFNDYTPPPKRDDYVFATDFREFGIDVPIQEEKEEDFTINTDATFTEIEAEGEAVSFFGYVSIHVGKKERKRAHARLKNMHLSFHDDDETSDYLCGPFHLTGCQMISRSDNTISIRLNELETQKHVTFCVEDSQDHWSLILSECWLTQHESLRSSAVGMTTCGTFHLRQGTTAQWQMVAAGLHDRTLYYVYLDNPDCIYELDLRKVISFREKTEKDQWSPLVKKKSHRGSFMLVLEGCTLYIECDDEWSTNQWYKVVEEAITRPAKTIDEFRLTGDNIPIAVDKCIRFVSAYGMTLEGIHRKNGKSSESRDVVDRLIQDPTGVHLKRVNDETVYAVADALRLFFRRLPTPLIPHNIQASLFNIVSTRGDIKAKCAEIGSVLQGMPLVSFNTIRKVMSHLKDVTNNSSANLASIENLAKMFGTSLFHTESETEPVNTENSNQISVIALLISHYGDIFDPTDREELSREIVEQAQKFKVAHPKAVRADGLLVPIHIWEKENMPFNVKTDLAAEEVCREAVAKRGFDGKLEEKYALFEYIRDGVLSRRLADYERLQEPVINRWIPWKCTDGYLLFDKDTTTFDDIDNMSSYSGKVKVAEPGSKSFKSMELKVSEGHKVVAYKSDKRNKEWSLDTTVWYLGAEPSRKAPYSYSATFFTHENNNFSEKYVGFCVSFKSSVERTKFINQIFYLQYSGQPKPLVHI